MFVEQTSCYTILVYRKAQKSNGSFSSLAIHHTHCDQTCAQYWTVRNCNTRNKETWRGSVARHVPAVEMAAGKACVILHGCCHIVGYCLRSVWNVRFSFQPHGTFNILQQIMSLYDPWGAGRLPLQRPARVLESDVRPRHEFSLILDCCCLTRFRDGHAIGS